MSDRHGKGKKSRPGTHRSHRSAETQLWERGRLIPMRPPWMSEADYLRLAALRKEIARSKR